MIDEISIARQKISRMAVSVATIAIIAGVSATELGLFLSGQRNCPADKARKINQTADRLEKLVRALEPIPVDMRQAVVLREVLMRLEDGSLKAIVFGTEQ
jgi:hypothetical protein